jgi:bifunctional DNA-binding transcriptional regulator/antitoxin component of YhaV-PrlF toxin-antitoxin module
MEHIVKIEPNGVLTIPEEYRQILGIATGDEVALRMKDHQLIVSLPQQATKPALVGEEAVRYAQAMVRQYIPAGRSLVDELIAERRQEAARGE